MHYRIKAISEADEVSALTLDAPSDVDARLQAEQRGYRVLSLKTAQKPLWKTFGDGGFALVSFSQELLALLAAGLPLVESLEALAEKEHRVESRRILEQILLLLRQGRSLSSTLEQFPGQFPPLYVSTVRASEKTGDMAEALSRYVDYQSQMNRLRKKIVSASIYPAMLLAVGGLVTIFLMAYVVPRFSRIYEDVGGNLPLMSQLLLEWGRLLETHGMEVFAGFIALLIALSYAVRHPVTRRQLMFWLWSIPAIGERLRLYQLARCYRTVGMLLRGGTPAVTALGMATGLLPPNMQEYLLAAIRQIHEGQSISRAMEAQGLTTPVALRMLRVGERSGKMGEMMERIACFYDEEMTRWVDWLTRLIEPLLMALIGLVIGVIVILMYFPIFELAGSIQ